MVCPACRPNQLSESRAHTFDSVWQSSEKKKWTKHFLQQWKVFFSWECAYHTLTFNIIVEFRRKKRQTKICLFFGVCFNELREPTDFIQNLANVRITCFFCNDRVRCVGYFALVLFLFGCCCFSLSCIFFFVCLVEIYQAPAVASSVVGLFSSRLLLLPHPRMDCDHINCF